MYVKIFIPVCIQKEKGKRNDPDIQTYRIN